MMVSCRSHAFSITWSNVVCKEWPPPFLCPYCVSIRYIIWATLSSPVIELFKLTTLDWSIILRLYHSKLQTWVQFQRHFMPELQLYSTL